MYLRRLFVQNFRNYEEALLDFSPGINLLWGANAQGKTSLLEAIYLLFIGRSFRTLKSQDLVRKDSESYCIEAHFVRQGVEQKVKIAGNSKERKIVYNSTELPSASALLGILPGVLLAPDDDLVNGPPTARRLFLDLQIAQMDPLYIHHCTRYNRALRQRNHLLRSPDSSSIESWEHEMAHAAGYITQKRQQAIKELQQIVQPLYGAWGQEKSSLVLHYQSKVPNPENPQETFNYYVSQWHNHRFREMAIGSSLYGPHRDEMPIFIGDQEARTFGSEGQKRLCVAALRLAVWERLRKAIGESPLILLDDVGMGLDEERYGRLMQHLENVGQVFLTSTRRAGFAGAKEFHVVQGSVQFA